VLRRINSAVSGTRCDDVDAISLQDIRKAIG
jgi:hypothetical protein